MSLFSWLSNISISEADVRSEIWRLGNRHFGNPLEGALDELRAANVPEHRTLLLQACVRELRRR